ncbi:hypothetical protein [Mucilaginibacter gilvus]|uniref:Uncharacterized protein n=1 Tax=Mucilaginibacter gilvus TaxID=2305909 RepID=A0A3S3Z4G7_9SPHI|nr:hypothetical protein [Mucilaginibacter gilvus]RWY57144.1 hypothetical protein EPL05_01010 [Mucilaginibacter gilvus]
MRPALLFFSLCFALAGNSAHQINAALQQKKTKADVAMDQVAAVPEVKAFLKKHASEKAILLLQGEPKNGRKYYWVSLGISNFERFRPTEHFYVDPKTWEVFYLDIFISDGGDKILTLEQWRHWRKTPGWKKTHYYEHGKLMVEQGK